jgi:hypothetical protein
MKGSQAYSGRKRTRRRIEIMQTLSCSLLFIPLLCGLLRKAVKLISLQSRLLLLANFVLNKQTIQFPQTSLETA